MTNYQNRRRWAIDQQKKARTAHAADQPRQDAERAILDEMGKLNEMLLDPDHAKDHAKDAAIWEQIVALNIKLAEIRTVANRK